MNENYYEPPRVALKDGPGRPDFGDMINRCLLVLVAMTAAAPIALLSIPYTFAWRASVHLGRWPTFNNPDPKALPDDLGPSPHLQIVIPVIVFLATAGLFVMLFRWCDRTVRRMSMAILGLLGVGSWVGSIIFFALDPFGVMLWIFD